MEELIIRGGNPLYGDVPVYGAKNSILPLLAASLLVKEKARLKIARGSPTWIRRSPFCAF